MLRPEVDNATSRLVKACGGGFTTRARRTGATLFGSGRVALEGFGKDITFLSVQDDKDAPYRIAIDFGDLDHKDLLRAECQCAFFTAGHLCGHVFAALLVLDTSGESHPFPSVSALGRPIDIVAHKFGLPLGVDTFFASAGGLKQAGGAPEHDWRARLDTLERATPVQNQLGEGILERVELFLDAERSRSAGAIVVGVRAETAHNLGWQSVALSRRDLDRVRSPETRSLLEPWLACPPLGEGWADATTTDPGYQAAAVRRVPVGLQRALLTSLSGSLRYGIDGPPLTVEAGAPYRFAMRLRREEEETVLEGQLVRGDQRLGLSAADLILRDGWVIIDGSISELEARASHHWIRDLQRLGPIRAEAPVEEVLGRLISSPALPELELGEGFSEWTIDRPLPVPSLNVAQVDARSRRAAAELQFVYGDVAVDHHLVQSGFVIAEEQRLVLRSLGTEAGWKRRLLGSGIELDEGDQLNVRGGALAELEVELVREGANVVREGRALRGGGEVHLEAHLSEEELNLSGELRFGSLTVPLAVAIRAARANQTWLPLEDGTEGMLADGDARLLRALVGLGKEFRGGLRFSTSQAILVDALLGDNERARRDGSFLRHVSRLRENLVLRPEPEPEGFEGRLRPYQMRGLGWLDVLHRIGLGGCLADDMGLGKTIQALALLQKLAAEGQLKRPALVVAPRSLVFNWKNESAKFAPELRVLEYSGQQRSALLDEIANADLILTTYGTLRRDIEVLSELELHLVILDEAQTIKNHASQVNKACRSLNATHRLALSGTPVENEVSELWAIFEFLNPSMLGSRREFVKLTRGGALELVGRGLAPLLLRRRKEDVLDELPAKVEQTVYCDLRKDERELYEGLKARLRTQIDRKIADQGSQSVRIDVLEALLRLRQTACHAGLVDAERKSQRSTKVETLIEHLQEVVAEGHKALVFSQFVKLLEIVRGRLDDVGLPFAYLDGSVRDRASVVDRFQKDPDCSVFLISLKAGGLGLNLTAADYVFILDPWWNPAVEAQAIDRAHRIGQKRKVFAYRYIARDTVEERIVALHHDKRALAEALVQGDGDTRSRLSLDELRLLLQ